MDFILSKSLEYLKKGIVLYSICRKKKSCHLVPKVVIDLSFEERKVEGSQRQRRWERVLKVGSRRKETTTEPINSRIEEYHTTTVGI